MRKPFPQLPFALGKAQPKPYGRPDTITFVPTLTTCTAAQRQMDQRHSAMTSADQRR